MFQRFTAFLILSLILSTSRAQDSSDVAPKAKINWLSFTDDPHSPTKATVFSAVIPGLGQAYNRKFWKVPVVYVALGGAAYYMLDQRASMRKLNANFRIRYSDTVLQNNPGAEELQTRDGFRKGRDIGILALAGLYVIQIIDATVDAHFYKFDIDQNLSATFRPSTGRFMTISYRF